MKHARKDYNERIQDSANIIPEDEPVFLIRAQDEIGIKAVRCYANECEAAGLHKLATHVREQLGAMKDWEVKKMPTNPEL